MDHTAAASAIAGTAAGETKETASTFGTPVDETASRRRARPSTGSGVSDWSPSRGPTSRMVTVGGNDLLTGRSIGPRSRPFGTPSAALPPGVALLVEGSDALPAIVARQVSPPGQVLELDPRVERKPEPPVHGLLGLAHRHRRRSADVLREVHRGPVQELAEGDPLDEPQLERLGRGDPLPREDQLLRPGDAELSGQKLRAASARNDHHRGLRQPEHSSLRGD